MNTPADLPPVIAPSAPPPLTPPAHQADRETVERLIAGRVKIESELAKVIVGQKEVIEEILIALFAGGHCLITGAPGLAKTLLVKSIAQIFHLKFQRIQFTPDLMPSDMTGTDIIEEDPGTGHRTWTFVRGPLFANVLLADEINRTPPKTQSALLEAMQEGSCTVRGQVYQLPAPFFVLATQNPIELEGTYPLPEAQLDRFLFNTILDYLSADDELKVVEQTTATRVTQVVAVTSAEELLDFQQLVRMVPIAETLARYVVNLVRATRHKSDNAPDFVKRYVNYGASVRAAQFIVLAAKARALSHQRYHVTYEDLTSVAAPVLRHRILLNFHAESERIDTDEILKRLVAQVPRPKES
jgi:MoxR-like ATPase